MEQISFFDGTKKFKIDKPIRLIELFAGYGSQALALKYLGVSIKHHRISEWAVKSIQAYKDMHFAEDNVDYSQGHELSEIKAFLLGRISFDYSTPATEKQIERLSDQQARTIFNNMLATNNLGSITKIHGDELNIVDTDKYCYILTYSFPCQDLSSAGLGKGMERGSGTRSGLLWEVERLLKECKEKPQVLLMENVPEVKGKKNANAFREWQLFLESIGYKNKWEVLNSKDFGVAQSRNRCFMVSILGNYFYEMPKGFELKHRMKDFLDKEIEETYYLKDGTLNYFIRHSKESEDKGNGFRFSQAMEVVNMRKQLERVQESEWTITL